MDITQHKFANIVRVLAQTTEDKSVYTVFWRSGLQKQGKLVVNIPIEIGDKAAIAELCAMQFLIDEIEVIGRTPPLKGLLLEFSAAAIKKLHGQKSEKRHLYPYAYYLTTRFSSATVQISKDDAWISPRTIHEAQFITITEPPGQLVSMATIGKVAVTKHIIDQYRQRMNNIEPDVAWKLLTKTLETVRPILLVNDDKRKLRDQIHHRNEGARYYDKDSKWCFVVADNAQGKKTIVTAYISM